MVRKPTVIGQKPEALTPTAMPGAKVAPQPPTVAEPKRMVAPTTMVTAPPPPLKVTPPTVTTTVLPGVVRTPLVVDERLLRERYPSYTNDEIEELLSALKGVTLSLLDSVAIGEYGLSVQQQYAATVNDWLTLVNTDAVRQSPRHIQRLQELLGEVAETLNDRSWFKRTSPYEKFAEVRPEVDQLRGLLDANKSALVTISSGLASLFTVSRKLQSKATGYMLACDYIASLIDTERAEQIVARGISLGQTVSLLQAQGLQLEQSEQQLRQLINQINDGVFVALPAWITSVLSNQQKEMNDTQRYLLKDQLMAVIRKLT